MKNLQEILLPYQRDFILAPKKRKLWLAARQIGKSFSLGYLAVYKALSKKGGLALIISTGARASSEIIKKVTQFADAVKVMSNSRIDYTASADCVKFNNGSRVMSLPSGNPSALRGYTSVATIIDEAAFIERPEEVLAAILPTLTRDPNSELVVASTPAGKNSLFYEMYNSALDDEEWYVQTTNIYDAKDAGLNVDIDSLRTLCPDEDIFKQEYLCQFNAEYSQLIDTSLLEFIDPPDNIEALPHWMGMDVGSTSDRTAIVDLVQLPDETLLVADATIMHKASYESQLEMVKEKHAKNHYRGGYIDQNGIGSALAEFVTKKVSTLLQGFTWTGTNKGPAYERLRAGVFDHKLKFAKHLKNQIIADISNVHRIVTESGQVKYEAGRNADGHSDLTSAIVLALEANASRPQQISMPTSQILQSMFGAPRGSRLMR